MLRDIILFFDFLNSLTLWPCSNTSGMRVGTLIGLVRCFPPAPHLPCPVQGLAPSRCSISIGQVPRHALRAAAVPLLFLRGDCQ